WATENGQNPWGVRIIGKEPSYWIVPLLALVCVMASLAIATVASPRRNSPVWAAQHAQEFDERKWRVGLTRLGWAFLALAMLASALYTRAYGGVTGFFEVAGALR